MTGRPSTYSEELAALICEHIASGKTLASLCEQDGMPSRATVWRWTTQYPIFLDQLTRARQAGADMLADETVDIADSEPDAQRARNRIEARKWYAGVINPRRYGPRMDISVTERVSITDALAAARARHEALEARPIRDQLPHDETQVIDIPSQSIAGPPDSESDPDPFS